MLCTWLCCKDQPCPINILLVSHDPQQQRELPAKAAAEQQVSESAISGKRSSGDHEEHLSGRRIKSRGAFVGEAVEDRPTAMGEREVGDANATKTIVVTLP